VSTWIPSAEAFGNPSQVLILGATGVPSAGAFGSATVTHTDVTYVLPTGVPSGEAFGTLHTAFLLKPTGVLTREAFGTPVLNTTVNVILASGTTYGHGQITLGEVLLAGTVTSTGNLNSPSPTIILNFDPVIFGRGQLIWNGPDQARGFGTLAAFMEIIHIPAPACATCTCPKTAFHWMQDFQKGDLGICLTDNFGNPIGPVMVQYTLFWVQKGCVPHQVGCCGRKPVSAGLGKYYITGTAGEGGQPGLWIARWQFQKSFGAPIQERDVCFFVQDAIAAGDKTFRVCKYGWD